MRPREVLRITVKREKKVFYERGDPDAKVALIAKLMDEYDIKYPDDPDVLDLFEFQERPTRKPRVEKGSNSRAGEIPADGSGRGEERT